MLIVTTSLALFTSSVLAEDAKPAAKAVDVKAAKELLAKTDCNACHNARQTGVGPSYKAMAKKIGNDEAKITKAIVGVTKGFSGASTYEGAMTPQAMMPAHPALKAEEIENLVRYMVQAGAK